MRLNQTTEINASNPLINTMGKPTYTLHKTGLVSEIIYDPQNPFTFHLLLPFLQQLGKQPRWQLWFSQHQRLNRAWIKRLGLSEEKTMAINTTSTTRTLALIEKALRSGNFSAISVWLPSLSPHVKEKLYKAAIDGDCYCFILQPLSVIQDKYDHNNKQRYKKYWH